MPGPHRLESRRRKFAIAGGVAATLAVLPVAAILVLNAGIARAAVVQLWPLKPFTHCTPDPRIECEPGAEDYARALAPLLPAAVDRVERAQYGPFAGPVAVHVYASVDSYARYGGGSGGAGRVAFGTVHISPVLRDRPGDHAGLLAHELSHLHLGQRIGTLAMMRLPVWFREGYPTMVADWGGAGRVEPDNAIFALVHGRHFEAEADAAPLAPHMWDHFKVSAPMFYRQSALMVNYLQRRDPVAFDRMMGAIGARRRFGDAVRDAYGQPLPVLWRDFRAGLRSHPAARWDFSPASEGARG